MATRKERLKLSLKKPTVAVPTNDAPAAVVKEEPATLSPRMATIPARSRSTSRLLQRRSNSSYRRYSNINVSTQNDAREDTTTSVQAVVEINHPKENAIKNDDVPKPTTTNTVAKADFAESVSADQQDKKRSLSDRARKQILARRPTGTASTSVTPTEKKDHTADKKELTDKKETIIRGEDSTNADSKMQPDSAISNRYTGYNLQQARRFSSNVRRRAVKQIEKSKDDTPPTSIETSEQNTDTTGSDLNQGIEAVKIDLTSSTTAVAKTAAASRDALQLKMKKFRSFRSRLDASKPVRNFSDEKKEEHSVNDAVPTVETAPETSDVVATTVECNSLEDGPATNTIATDVQESDSKSVDSYDKEDNNPCSDSAHANVTSVDGRDTSDASKTEASNTATNVQLNSVGDASDAGILNVDATKSDELDLTQQITEYALKGDFDDVTAPTGFEDAEQLSLQSDSPSLSEATKQIIHCVMSSGKKKSKSDKNVTSPTPVALFEDDVKLDECESTTPVFVALESDTAGIKAEAEETTQATVEDVAEPHLEQNLVYDSSDTTNTIMTPTEDVKEDVISISLSTLEQKVEELQLDEAIPTDMESTEKDAERSVTADNATIYVPTIVDEIISGAMSSDTTETFDYHQPMISLFENDTGKSFDSAKKVPEDEIDKQVVSLEVCTLKSDLSTLGKSDAVVATESNCDEHDCEDTLQESGTKLEQLRNDSVDDVEMLKPLDAILEKPQSAIAEEPRENVNILIDEDEVHKSQGTTLREPQSGLIEDLVTLEIDDVNELDVATVDADEEVATHTKDLLTGLRVDEVCNDVNDAISNTIVNIDECLDGSATQTDDAHDDPADESPTDLHKIASEESVDEVLVLRNSPVTVDAPDSPTTELNDDKSKSVEVDACLAVNALEFPVLQTITSTDLFAAACESDDSAFFRDMARSESIDDEYCVPSGQHITGHYQVQAAVPPLLSNSGFGTFVRAGGFSIPSAVLNEKEMTKRLATDPPSFADSNEENRRPDPDGQQYKLELVTTTAVSGVSKYTELGPAFESVDSVGYSSQDSQLVSLAGILRPAQQRYAYYQPSTDTANDLLITTQLEQTESAQILVKPYDAVKSVIPPPPPPPPPTTPKHDKKHRNLKIPPPPPPPYPPPDKKKRRQAKKSKEKRENDNLQTLTSSSVGATTIALDSPVGGSSVGRDEYTESVSVLSTGSSRAILNVATSGDNTEGAASKTDSSIWGNLSRDQNSVSENSHNQHTGSVHTHSDKSELSQKYPSDQDLLAWVTRKFCKQRKVVVDMRGMSFECKLMHTIGKKSVFNRLCDCMFDSAKNACPTMEIYHFQLMDENIESSRTKLVSFLRSVAHACSIDAPLKTEINNDENTALYHLRSGECDTEMVFIDELLSVSRSSAVDLVRFTYSVNTMTKNKVDKLSVKKGTSNDSTQLKKRANSDKRTSVFERAVRSEPLVLAYILGCLGDPVVVCKTKQVCKTFHAIIDDNEHVLLRDAVRLGGLSMNHRPAFWLWVTLEKTDFEGDKNADLEWNSLRQLDTDSKWYQLIERDVSRSFGNFPPHKSGSRFRRDSIVRALVTWGRSRTLKRGVKGTRDPATIISETYDEDCDQVDKVADWGAVTPVGSFASSVSGRDDHSESFLGMSKNDVTSVVSATTTASANLPVYTPNDELALGGNALTDETKKQLQDKLRIVLQALAVAHPDVGYCQGMDYIVAHLLRLLQDTVRWKAVTQRLPARIQSAPKFDTPYKQSDLNDLLGVVDETEVVEEACFRVMNTFFNTYGLKHFYWPELRCLKTCCLVFEKLVQIKLPVLADHFEHHELNVGLFALGWFQTLFLYLPSMPTATVCTIWDIWLVERSFKIFFRVGIAILFLSQPILLNQELEGMMGYLNTFPDSTLLSSDILIACALQIKVTNKVLAEIEEKLARRRS